MVWDSRAVIVFWESQTLLATY